MTDHEAEAASVLGADSQAASTELPHTQTHNTADDGRRGARTEDATVTATSQWTGNVLPSPEPASQPAGDASRAKELATTVMNRLKAQKRWFGIVALERDRMMQEAKEAIPDLIQRQLWVYSELDRMYPPVQSETAKSGKNPDNLPKCHNDTSGTDSGQIQGLSDLPEDWPELPANAALAAEVGWVQANRLRITSEKASGATVVRLDQALSPAPSWAALGWLETSIRSYAKFVDVAAKVSGGAEDETAVMRRERKSIDEVKALLAEMEEAEGVCPSCGKPFAGN